MLRHLSIRDIVLIDRLDITVGPGLGVLTGETGAGKSILLDSLGLALGGRAEQRLIRPGSDSATVTASFEISNHPAAQTLLAEQDIILGDDDLVLRRTLAADGRSRAFVNDQPISVGLLRALGSALVEIQGQHELHDLMDPASHLTLLDGFASEAASHTKLTKNTSQTYDHWQTATAELAAAEAALAQDRRDEEWLREAIEKLEDLAPQPGEAKRLAAMRQLAQHAEKIGTALEDAARFIGSEDGAEASLQRALHKLDSITDLAGDSTRAVYAALERASAEAGEALRDLQSVIAASDINPAEAAAADDRLFALRTAAKRHDVEVDDLSGELENLHARLSTINNRSDAITKLTKSAEVARRAYHTAAEQLSKSRSKAAKRLDRSVNTELPPLKLENAAFHTQFERMNEREWGPHGLDQVRFEVRTNPGSDFGAIERVASGGELARFMLAIKVVIAGGNPNRTLVFDEVDSGIGGATAAAVGDRLARLAASRQVLVVTHSPQVAAVGAIHLQVSKQAGKKTARTIVEEITDEQRTEEIARMISGAHVTDEARAAAIKLIRGAA